ncbi:hypothetical protein [Priestia megaterium]|uniref:hypothetical protein n=1 Tax=Priestia megaterium TaxID=1404 RepID=UPI0028608419|nr:hypothetical protein [Priestia megaterium]MDR7246342.1 hypothetical protein [Priestia megaterium]
MNNFYLAMANPNTSNIEVMGWDISVSTLVTAIIGAILGSILGQWLSHVFSTKREDQKYHREIFQELFFEYIDTVFISCVEALNIDDSKKQKINSLTLAKKHQEIKKHILGKLKYTNPSLAFLVTVYNDESFSDLSPQLTDYTKRCFLISEFLSYMYISGVKAKMVNAGFKALILMLLITVSKELLKLNVSKILKLKWGYRIIVMYIKLLFYKQIYKFF